MSRGGKRQGAGRKPKKDELSLIESMDKYDPKSTVWGKLWDLVEKKDVVAIKLWLSYRHGAPVQTLNNNNTGEIKVVYETDDTDNTFTETT